MRITPTLIIITLFAISLAVSDAGIFSRNPKTPTNNDGRDQEQVIVKEGHRDVAVEYSTGDDTKVTISPEKGAVEEQLSRAAASIAGVAQDAKGVFSDPDGVFGSGPRELICDAVGKCEHRIAGALRKAKEKAARAEEGVKEAVEKVRGLASRRTGGVRQNAAEKVRQTGEAAEKIKTKAGEVAENVREKTGEAMEETAEQIKQKGVQGKNKVSNMAKAGKEYIFWPKSVGSLMGVVQMLGFATAYGMSMWVTFVMSRVLAGMLPRQQFGMVQSRVYPVYFKAMVGSISLALLGHVARQRGRMFRDKAEVLQGANLALSLVMALANLRFLEPAATKAMFEKIKVEKEEGRGRDDTSAPAPAPAPADATNAEVTAQAAEKDEAESKIAKLDNRLKRLNSYSSMLNIATLTDLTWHLMYLGEHLAVKS